MVCCWHVDLAVDVAWLPPVRRVSWLEAVSYDGSLPHALRILTFGLVNHVVRVDDGIAGPPAIHPHESI